MLAPSCECRTPQVFEDSESCNTCGRAVPVRITASTWRLALAIAEVALGYRKVGDTHGRDRSPPAA